ncbi:extracellular catalytic domain type 2 short-chain-length polyhydroxyalkanoate depolymerase [Derxia gummosa]|uniref:Extracellular catalytic domain type 2 short-chain-length polyhydroxyalkanoate depolymerase n=1 Tax=Derxia gummosa DSM 723 TaxID=1121388 RepID=A0A8B6X7X9_9BURK|nr:poly(3-hydroxybutyrate) depolymerase [Derxia gummosa]
MSSISPKVEQLASYNVVAGESSVSGLSSGAFMTVQLHVALSSRFCGAGVIAGGPWRASESFPRAAFTPDDSRTQNALYICMAPLVPSVGPDAAHSLRLARNVAAEGGIDPIANLGDDRVYVFTGSKDTVVASSVVAQTKRFYELLGVTGERLRFVDHVPAGHSIITMNPEDNDLGTNFPPFINRGDFVQSHEVLHHIYPWLKPATDRPTGRLVRFDQTEFFGEAAPSMSRFGYAWVPRAVEEGAPARVHIALHGCKQGYNYVNYVNGRADTANNPPYGNRYVTTTGYIEIADANDIVVLFPQAEGMDDSTTLNPEGCWDWWGYTGADYFTQAAPQIAAIARMLDRLGA